MKQRLTGLAYLLTIIVILVGLPAALVAVGSPWPARIPAAGDVWGSLTSPDDGRLALAALTVLGWICWLVITVSVLLEVAARLRGTAKAPSLPGLALPQSWARGLVAGALLLLSSTPTDALATPADITSSHAATPPATVTAPVGPAASTPTESEPPAATHSEPTASITVMQGDSLWALAETHLGDGREFTKILDLNRDVLGDNSAMLKPGTILQIPAPAHEADAEQVTVKAGDTLSGIAQDALGDADKYPQIAHANPDLVHDPDHIETGWVLAMPETGTPRANSAPGESAPPPASPPAEDTSAADRQAKDPAPTAAVATPRSTTTQTQTPAPTSSRSAAPSDAAPASHTQVPAPAWAVTGLTGAGAVLAGGLFLRRRLVRQRAMRGRRPGRTIVAPSPEMATLDRTITHVGSTTVATIDWMDNVLRRVAAATTDGHLPSLIAVELATDEMTLHLDQPMPAPQPWQVSQDQKRWTLPTDTDLDDVGPHEPDHEAPWPMLVTIGATQGRPWWLLNLEDLTLEVTGDDEHAEAFARYLAAEIAVNAWSSHARVHLMGVGSELDGLNPERMTTHPDWNEEAGAQLLLETIETIDRADDLDADVPTLRATGQGQDAWPARALIVAGTPSSEALTQLEQTVRSAASRTSTGIIRINPDHPSDEAMAVDTDATGRVRLPRAGLDLDGVGLTPDEARTCAQLAAEYRRQDPAPIPGITEPAQPWQNWSDAAGALREEHTLPRDTPADEEATTISILDAADEDYLHTGATTEEDLAALSPQVSADTAADVQDADPTLDDDLAAWWSDTCPVPRVTFLGPVNVRPANGIPVSERKPYLTEVVSYLALHPNGVTNGDLRTDFDISEARVRTVLNQVRDWLGTNPNTGQKHQPYAGKGPAGQQRGVSVYELVDVLTDADLLRRLRLRGQARGPEGVEDLLAALRLVQGAPFSQLRNGGWSWLTGGERIDEEVFTHAIVDTAHLATTACLQSGDLNNARLATTTALHAAPHEHIPQLDMARITEAEGDAAAADNLVRDDICNAPDDDSGTPLDLPDRTQQIIDNRAWARPRRQAS